MAEANFDIDPIPYDANTPELDLDVEMEDSGDERGEANFMADIEVLDALYLRETIEQIKNISENIPNTTNQPPIPQILLQLPAKENGNELKRKRPAQKQVTELIEELQRSYRQIDVLPSECVPDITENYDSERSRTCLELSQ